mmetsp:Transcript_23479/g.41212  ORF Transcript_23479/g.41212 Transcript_23479/m.41212 type:complete len:84 (+) Transcript_23479:100-351(+)
MGMLNYCDWSVLLAHNNSEFLHRSAFDMKAHSPLVRQMLPAWLQMMMMNSMQELKYKWLLLMNSTQKELQIRELKAKMDFGGL